jgi:hypothetical protein
VSSVWGGGATNNGLTTGLWLFRRMVEVRIIVMNSRCVLCTAQGSITVQERSTTENVCNVSYNCIQVMCPSLVWKVEREINI